MPGPCAFSAARLLPGLILSGLAAVAAAQSSRSPPPQVNSPDATTPVGRSAKPPPGYLVLCQRDPEECRASSADPATDEEIRDEATSLYWKQAFAPQGAPAAGSSAAAPAVAPPPVAPPDPNAPQPPGLSESGELILAPQVWALMYRLNGMVNRDIRMRSDDRQYSQVDYWAVESGPGVQYGDCEDYALTKRRLLIEAGIPPRVLSFGIVRTSWGELHAILIVKSEQGDLILDNLSADILRWNMTGYDWIKRQMPGDPFDWRRVND